MRTIAMTYHRENGTWWADSADLPGFTAAASSIDELRGEVVAGVAFELDDEPVRIILRDESGAALDSRPFVPQTSDWFTKAGAQATGFASSFSHGIKTSAAFTSSPAFA